MLLRELKLLEVDDSITDRIPSLARTINIKAADVPVKSRADVGKIIFQYRYNNEPAYSRAQLLKTKIDDNDLEKYFNGLAGIMKNSLRKIPASFDKKTMDEVFAVNAAAGNFSDSSLMSIQASTTWKSYSDQILKLNLDPNRFMSEIDSKRKSIILNFINKNQQLIINELSSEASAISFIKLKCQNLHELFSTKPKEALLELEDLLGMLVIFERNCADARQALNADKKDEPKTA